MIAIQFPEANLDLAKNQPQYATLPVMWNNADPEGPMTCCMQLSPEEIAEINRTGCLWFTQITHNKGYAPIRMSVLKPEWPDPSALGNKWTAAAFVPATNAAGYSEDVILRAGKQEEREGYYDSERKQFRAYSADRSTDYLYNIDQWKYKKPRT